MSVPHAVGPAFAHRPNHHAHRVNHHVNKKSHHSKAAGRKGARGAEGASGAEGVEAAALEAAGLFGAAIYGAEEATQHHQKNKRKALCYERHPNTRDLRKAASQGGAEAFIADQLDATDENKNTQKKQRKEETTAISTSQVYQSTPSKTPQNQKIAEVLEFFETIPPKTASQFLSSKDIDHLQALIDTYQESGSIPESMLNQAHLKNSIEKAHDAIILIGLYFRIVDLDQEGAKGNTGYTIPFSKEEAEILFKYTSPDNPLAVDTLSPSQKDAYEKFHENEGQWVKQRSDGVTMLGYDYNTISAAKKLLRKLLPGVVSNEKKIRDGVSKILQTAAKIDALPETAKLALKLAGYMPDTLHTIHKHRNSLRRYAGQRLKNFVYNKVKPLKDAVTPSAPDLKID